MYIYGSAMAKHCEPHLHLYDFFQAHFVLLALGKLSTWLGKREIRALEIQFLHFLRQVIQLSLTFILHSF